MPILLPPPPADEVRSLWGPKDIADGQGDVAQLVLSNLAKVQRHWRDRSDESPVSEDDVILSYRHVTLEVVGTRRVRYASVESLEPRRITVEDDDE